MRRCAGGAHADRRRPHPRALLQRLWHRAFAHRVGHRRLFGRQCQLADRHRQPARLALRRQPGGHHSRGCRLLVRHGRAARRGRGRCRGDIPPARGARAADRPSGIARDILVPPRRPDRRRRAGGGQDRRPLVSACRHRRDLSEGQCGGGARRFDHRRIGREAERQCALDRRAPAPAARRRQAEEHGGAQRGAWAATGCCSTGSVPTRWRASTAT